MRIKIRRVAGLAVCGVVVAICSGSNAVAAAPDLRSCMHSLPLLRASTWSPARRTLVPSGAVELRMCRYSGLNTRPPEHSTVASFFDDLASIAEISRSFDTLPKPTASQAHRCPDDTGATVIATFAYKSGHTVSVSVDLTGCNTATNGDVTRRGTSEFITDIKLATGGGTLPKIWQAPRPLQFRPTFQPVAGASGPQLPSADGSYIAIQQPGAVELIDEHTNASTVLTVPDCPQPVGGPQLAGPWLAETCPGVPSGIYETFVENLYSLATRQWRTIPVPAEDCVSDGAYGESGGTECELGPVGADWLGWTENCWNCGSRTGLFYLGPGQQPISTVPDTSATTVLDYNSPTLETTLCSPLRDTATNQLIVSATGQFVADQTPLGNYALANGQRGSVYLEHCGSHLHRQLPEHPVTGNGSELLFDPSGANVSGLFLPSLRKFVIQFPKALLTQQLAGTGKTVEVLEGIRLTARHIYVLGPDDKIWAAPAPTPPK